VRLQTSGGFRRGDARALPAYSIHVALQLVPDAPNQLAAWRCLRTRFRDPDRQRLMGITYLTVKFPTAAPPVQAILENAQRSSGLEIAIEHHSLGPLFREHADAHFAAHPREHVTLFVYDADEIARMNEADLERWSAADVRDLAASNPGVSAMLDRMIIEHVSAPSAGRTLHLRGYVGEEGTLAAVIALAAESLGGAIHPPLPERTRRACTDAITARELRRRHRRHQREMLTALLLAPFYLLFGRRRSSP
jgi:hypothetical protein